MSDLSPQARAIVDAARPAGRGTDADRERVRAALRLRLLAGAALTPDAGTPAPQPIAAGATKYVSVLVLAGLIGAGIWWRTGANHAATVDHAAHDDSVARPSTRTFVAPTAPVVPITPPSAPIVPSLPATPVAIVADPPVVHRERTSNATTVRPSALAHAPQPASPEAIAPAPVAEPALETPALPEAPAAQPTHSTLADETRRLDEARTALRTNPHYALELLDEWNAIRPNGELREERRAQRVAALCALGRVDGARIEADRLLDEAPRSPQAGRVRASCAFPGH